MVNWIIWQFLQPYIDRIAALEAAPNGGDITWNAFGIFQL